MGNILKCHFWSSFSPNSAISPHPLLHLSLVTSKRSILASAALKLPVQFGIRFLCFKEELRREKACVSPKATLGCDSATCRQFPFCSATEGAGSLPSIESGNPCCLTQFGIKEQMSCLLFCIAMDLNSLSKQLATQPIPLYPSWSCAHLEQLEHHLVLCGGDGGGGTSVLWHNR